MLDEPILEYCESIRRAVDDPSHAPEQSLYPALHQLLTRLLPELAGRSDLTVTHQAQTSVGAPDFKVSILHRPPLGFVEAKPPASRLTPRGKHDIDQFARYGDLPNWIYTNFWELHLYHRAELVSRALLVPREALDPMLPLSLDSHDIGPALELLQGLNIDLECAQEFLGVVGTVEATCSLQAELEEALDVVVTGGCFTANELGLREGSQQIRLAL
jgi:hypothetical protein